MVTNVKRVFTREYREQAVKLVFEQGLGLAQAARQLGVNVKTYSRWVQLARSEGGSRHLKKGQRVLCQAPKVKYAHLEHQVRQTGSAHSVAAHLRAFELSSAGYYDWRARCKQPANCCQVERDSVAVRAHAKARHSYGARRLQVELAELGHKRSLATVKRMRKRLGLVCPAKRRWVRTTDSNHDQPIAPNVLEQRFGNAQAPNQLWVVDITYIPTQEGWLYLAGVKDLFTKRIVGWAMHSHMQKSLVEQALQMAITCQRPPKVLPPTEN